MPATPDFSFLDDHNDDDAENLETPEVADSPTSSKSDDKQDAVSEAEVDDASLSEDQTPAESAELMTPADSDDQAGQAEVDFTHVKASEESERPEFELYQTELYQTNDVTSTSEPDTNPELEIPPEFHNQDHDDPDTALIDATDLLLDNPEQPGILSPENVNWSDDDQSADRYHADGNAQQDESAVPDLSVISQAASAAAGATVISKTVEVKDPAEKSAKAETSQQSAKSKADSEAQSGRSTILISYASVMTLLCLYLLYLNITAKPHDLESLPDLKPPMKDDEIAYQLVPEKASLPAGHELTLGQSQRFGSLRVTPVKVTRETLEFEHYAGADRGTRQPDGPVLKLWLKFENVSDNQTFAPIDRELLLTRMTDTSDLSWVRSNQFVVSANQQGVPGKQLGLYDLEMHGDYDFQGVSNNPVIKPGETLEVYLPSEPEATSLTDEIVWRVQFRKGYNPESKRGVTTLVDVHFNASQIQAG